jgi:hypothetical protein
MCDRRLYAGGTRSDAWDFEKRLSLQPPVLEDTRPALSLEEGNAKAQTCLQLENRQGRPAMEMLAFVAPVTLVLGAGLFAAGALSLIGIHFLKTRLAERIAFVAGLALIVLTEFMFASSNLSTRFINGQRADVLECRRDAETDLPMERHIDSPRLQSRIVECMNKFGYEWTVGHTHCREAPVATNPFCYLPTRQFDRLATKFLFLFE